MSALSAVDGVVLDFREYSYYRVAMLISGRYFSQRL